MIKFIKEKKIDIKRIVKLCLRVWIIWTLLFYLVLTFTNKLNTSISGILFPILSTTLILLAILIIKIIKGYLTEEIEIDFFKKKPYSAINSYLIGKRGRHISKYDFKKNQRIIKINKKKYAIEYYSGFHNTLLVINLSEKGKGVLKIDNNKQRFTESEFINYISSN